MRNLVIAAILFALATSAPGQGPLDPPGPPGETMRSLEDLWNSISNLQAQVFTLQAQNDALSNQLVAADQRVSALSNAVELTYGISDAARQWALTAAETAIFATQRLAALDDVVVGQYLADTRPMISTAVTGLVSEASRTAMDLDPTFGLPYVAFRNILSDELRMAYFDVVTRTWQLETLPVTAPRDIAMVLNQTMSAFTISYIQWASVPASNRLEVALGIPGGGWAVMKVDTNDVAWNTSIANTPDGYPAIAYSSWTGGGYVSTKLRYAGYNGSQWVLYTVDDSGDTGHHPSLAFHGTLPRISYADFANGDLKLASWNGAQWTTTVVDATGTVGEYSSLAILTNGFPAISYFGNSALKYAEWNGTSWNIETVDSEGVVGLYTSLAFYENRPGIAYYDLSRGDLKYAAWDGRKWNVRIVDASPPFEYVGTYPTLKFRSNGIAVITYQDPVRKSLKYVELPAL